MYVKNVKFGNSKRSMSGVCYKLDSTDWPSVIGKSCVCCLWQLNNMFRKMDQKVTFYQSF